MRELNAYKLNELPVLIIGYRRITNIRQMIHKLQEIRISNILVSLDYSTSEEVREEQQHLIKEFDFPGNKKESNVEFWVKSRNHGIAAGVISAIDWLFTKHEIGVVLEDDLDFNEDFLRFCQDALHFYRDEQDIYMISGNRFDEDLNTSIAGAVNYPQIWGWATWGDRWEEMRRGILESDIRKCFNPVSAPKAFFKTGSTRVHEGLVDTWDIPLAYHFICSNKLCIIPPRNLVTNKGNDEHAIHTQSNVFPLNFPIAKLERAQFLNSVELRKELRSHNRYLERYVFLIRWYHFLSPMKYWLEKLLSERQNVDLVSLRTRIERAESRER